MIFKLLKSLFAGLLTVSSVGAHAELITLDGEGESGLLYVPETVLTVSSSDKGVITDLNVFIRMDGRGDELTATLTHLESSTSVRLWLSATDQGTEFDHEFHDIRTTFDDEAEQSFHSNYFTFQSAQFLSYQPYESLSVFDYVPIAGTWTLTLTHTDCCQSAESGQTLYDWKINAEVVPEPSSLAIFALAIFGLASGRARQR